MGNANVGILIGAKNNASAIIKQVSKDLSGINGAAQVATGGLAGIAGAFGAGAILLGVQQITAAIGEAVAAADQFHKVESSFEQLAATAGASGQQMLDSMRMASSGMINDTDLMLAANKAMMLGVANSADEMATLINIARSRGQAMGMDVGQAFSDIVTGLGRESALILDNLGIVINTTEAMGVYAASIGKVAEQLTSAERKQALLNAVMEQSASISTAPATGPGAALAQSQVAQQNAQVAVGDFFAPVWRDWANLQVDAINRIMGKYDEFAARTRDVMNLTADMANTKGSDPVMVNRLSDLSAAMAEVSIAMNNGVPNASAYADALTDIALSAYNTGVVTEQQTNLIELAVEGIRAETKAARDAAAARALANEQAQRASPYYQQLAAAHREVATAEELAAAEATLAKSSMEAFAQSMVGANAYAQALAGGLSTVQAQASATAGVIYDLRGALASLSTVSNGNVGGPDALDQVLPQINALAPQLVPELGLDAALAKVDELKIANRELYDTLKAQGYTENDILVALRANVNETQKWASGLGNVQTSAAGINKEFDKLVSATQSVIADSMDLGVTWEGMDSTQGGDSINENAKRLAAIANEGLQGQPWLDEFIAEVPGVYADLMLKQAAGVDVKTAAQQIMAEFQQGLRPELLDRDMIKQRVKDMIIGQENAAKLATEIAQELATEMNIPFQQALSAASSALGVAPTGAAGESATGGTVDMTGSGNAAGTTFAAGFAANADGTILIAGIVAKMETQLPRIYSAGAIHGTQWGAGFMSTVETSIGVPLVNLLTVLITPGVLAAIKANESQTTPP